MTDPKGYAEIPATSNLPFRSGKASLYEGGTREPGIVVWPGRVKPGTTADFLMQSTDIYPTVLAACGVSTKAGQKVDGFDQTSALTGGPSPRTQIFSHFPHGNAPRDAVMDGFYAGSSIREGDLKLIRFYARADDGSDELELYDLAEDPGERHNLAAERPEVASRLNDLLQRHLVDNEAVIPKLNPDYGKAAANELPGGLKNRAGTATVRDGVLSVRSKGKSSFLGMPVGLTRGTARISFRVRAPEAGDGKVTLIGEPGGPETHSVPYTVSGGSGWESVTIDLPVRQKTAILQLYLPSGSASVDFDDIVLTPPEGPPRRWTF
jgi:hypothetical protein